MSYAFPLSAEWQREADAIQGSAALGEATQGMLNDNEPRKLTFEEQLALVASGRARVIRKLPIRKADPAQTLGGVTW